MVNPWTIGATSFAACGVEAVEALTVVVAVGVTTSWRTAIVGAAGGLAALAALVAIFGPLLGLVPLVALKAVVGVVVLLVGQAWLRKAILRAGGRKALHDETAIFEREVQALRATANRRSAAATAFGAVLLEGLEVVIIVVTFGAAAGAGIAPAAFGALVAVMLVVLAGIAFRAPLARVPENTLKFAVGVMLSALGTLWSGESLGIAWPLGDGAVIVLALVFLAVAAGCVAALRRRALAV